MFIRFDRIHERDGQTDRHLMTAYRPRLCIASQHRTAKLIINIGGSMLKL